MDPVETLKRFFSDYAQKAESTRASETLALERFFSHYKYRENIYRSAERKVDKFLSSQFNIFSLLAREADELSLSRIIADMLRTDGVHGQGKVFIEIFLDLLARNIPDIIDHNIHTPIHKKRFTAFSVETEHTIPIGRRIDIFIKTDTDYNIIIENKIHALDLPNQVLDYLEYGKKIDANKFLLLYLTLDKHEPSFASIPPEQLAIFKSTYKFALISYTDFILPWFEACKNQCQSIRFRFFLEDCIHHLSDICNNRGPYYEIS